MKYTMEDLDGAIELILGSDVFRALNESMTGRVRMHEMAIQRAFMQKLDNRVSDILRAAMSDLSKRGAYGPYETEAAR